MASKPYPDKRRGIWRLKYRPDPTGPWVTVTLGKDPRLLGARPPQTPPQFVIDRARDFAEIEYRAKHGLAAGPARAKGLAAYLESYVDGYAATRRTGSVKQIRRHVASFLAFCERRGVASLQAVTKAVCRDYLEERSRIASPATLKTERGYLVGIWTRAVDDGLIAANPWTGVKPPGKATETSITFWSAAEITAIAGACVRPWQRDLVLVLANTGLRISTALAAGEIRIQDGQGVKTTYTHALNRVAREVLERRLATSKGADLVFDNPLRKGKPIAYDSAQEAIGKAIKRAGVKAGTPHDLRHSYGRALALAGVPITVIQRQLGHTTLAMTQKYTQAGEGTAAKYIGDWGVGES
jgi:integrase/recombinase XerD